MTIALLAGGCDGDGALDPRGEGADAIADLWWVMFWLSLVPVAIVLALVVRIAVRRRRAPRDGVAPAPGEASERPDRRMIMLGGVALPAVLLLPVIAMTLAATQAREPGDDPALEIAVTGNQFWWDLRYPGRGASRLSDGATFRTANEIHIPVGRPVELVGRSRDVIHSIWIPQIDGKIDLVPGRTNRLRIQANKAGVYQGRCAELCGFGHALMRFVVVAQPEDDFEEWRERESSPATVELDSATRQGFANSCAVCHTVRGVFERPAFRGTFGPDLTHLAARRMIGAGILPNTREALARWIVDPEGVKPDNRMPDVGLEGDALADVLDFLERLK